MIVGIGIEAVILFLAIGGFVALVAGACLVLFLVISLIAQIAESSISTGIKVLWIVLAIVLPGVSTVLWYFFSPRSQPTDEERIITSNWFAEIGQPI
ncbi:MAG: hypothetical protein JWR36_666 [Glaciihabitans sp.]|jgi:multisubunit Na+/H+ antiporter MnhB subunit|nr:hypothetical protein [Glaciihabitans sp.]MDQ1569911.1 hypothetical protein [Actinomycetota bacterium]